MIVRPAIPEQDAAACVAIYSPYVTASAVSFEEEAPSTDEFAERMRRVAVTHPWLVADRDGGLAGFAYASRHRERAAYRWATDVAVYVSADHRRAGVGRALYEELFTRLRAQGLRIACAGITMPNDGSVALHRALGFEPVGTYRGIGWKAGAWRDVSWWQLDLDPGAQDPPAEPRPARLGP